MREEARAVQAILAGYHSVNGSDDPIIVWVIRFPDACVRSHGDVSYYVAATGKVLFGGTDFSGQRTSHKGRRLATLGSPRTMAARSRFRE